MSTFRAASVGRPYDDTLGDLLGDLDSEAFSLSPLPSSLPSSDNSHNPLPTKHIRHQDLTRPHPHRTIHPRHQHHQRRAQKAPVAFLTAFVLILFVEARLLSLYAADVDLLDGQERARLVASAAFMYVLDGMVLLGGYFADCGRAWWAFLDLVTCGTYQGSGDDDRLGPGGDGAATGSEDDEVGGSDESCTSTRAIEMLLGVQMGMLLIAVWPLALAWIAILWLRDGVECVDPDVEEASADNGPAGARGRGRVSSTAADEKTPLLEGLVVEVSGPRDEKSAEEAMALIEEEAAKKRRAYAELMGRESVFGEF
ncbi:hypothetical protein ColKHC_10153 [Colletotrichum higginsianum]|uniref:Uncharacterized protein n=1 Tax=Colletotrichum higginsianum TaxID=80884 RepID=A0A4T0VHD2_9PEZI|nr:hypothetical protein CH35J_011395 [Colletotrichum higginsianum]GJD01328.1 hypothetical protein ColKHC_10153 [Colletotrichum higginsianum]